MNLLSRVSGDWDFTYITWISRVIAVICSWKSVSGELSQSEGNASNFTGDTIWAADWSSLQQRNLKRRIHASHCWPKWLTVLPRLWYAESVLVGLCDAYEVTFLHWYETKSKQVLKIPTVLYKVQMTFVSNSIQIIVICKTKKFSQIQIA